MYIYIYPLNRVITYLRYPLIFWPSTRVITPFIRIVGARLTMPEKLGVPRFFFTPKSAELFHPTGDVAGSVGHLVWLNNTL